MGSPEAEQTDRKSKLSSAKRALLEERLRGATTRNVDRITPHHRSGAVALSFAQERLWLLEQLEPGNTAYNISSLLKFSGALNQEALNRSINAIVARHESLRTSFMMIDSEVRQLVANEVMVTVQCEELRNYSNQTAELKSIAEAEARRPFDLTLAPLFRLRLVKTGHDQYWLILTMHHIIGDLWSLELFNHELSKLYDAYTNTREQPQDSLADLPIQYSDYALWQRSQFDGGKDKTAIAYWKQQLAAVPRLLELPTDKPRPPRLSFNGSFKTHRMPVALTRTLKELARQENATLFMVMLAAFNVLLHRYSNQTDILVGVPMTGRNRVETEKLIGFFVNTVVLRSDLSGRPSFRELLQRTRQVTIAAYEHQEVPLERLVQELQPPRGVGHSPFFQVMLDVQSVEHNTSGSWVAENLAVDRSGARADLILFVTDTESSLDCWLEYCTDLFESETIARMLTHFEKLLTAIAAEPDQSISTLELLPEHERQQLINWTEVKEAAADRTLVEMFAEQVKRNPKAIALNFEKERLSYEELNERANKLARSLVRWGVGPEVIVALCLERSIDLVVSILAILKAGGAYLPLDPTYPIDRLQFMVNDAQARVLITEKQHRDKVSGEGLQCLVLDEQNESLPDDDLSELPRLTGPQNLAYVIYTSGSTGKPKGVAVTHANVARLLSTTDGSFSFGSNDVWTLFHSYAFDFSVWELWGALLYGGRLVIVPYWISRTPEDFYYLLIDEQVTVLNQTPSAFRQLMQVDQNHEGNADLALRLVIFGGEALDLSSLSSWCERHGDCKPRLVNMYGITETTVHVTYRPIFNADLGSAGSLIGHGLGDLQVFVLDEQMFLKPIGVPGEMYVAGGGLSRGYLHRPELTAQRFVPNPYSQRPGDRLYRTGDVARFRANGDLEYLGRSDRQVKVRGFRIELGEIEAVLKQHPDIQDSIVASMTEATGDRQLAAYVVPHNDRSIDRETLRLYLRERLPAHMMPAFFVVLEKFPLTANGKIDRASLPAPEKTRDDAKLFVAPRTEAELKLAAMWSEVLGQPEISIYDNFFDLGGHSLLAAQIVARVSAAFNVHLPLRYFFDSPTVVGLAEFLQNAIKEEPAARAEIRRLPRA